MYGKAKPSTPSMPVTAKPLSLGAGARRFSVYFRLDVGTAVFVSWPTRRLTSSSQRAELSVFPREELSGGVSVRGRALCEAAFSAA